MALPIQAGVFYQINYRTALELVVTQYFSGTNYQDNVGGQYFNPQRLLTNKGELSYHLAYPRKGNDPGAPELTVWSSGGNSKNNDQFDIY